MLRRSDTVQPRRPATGFMDGAAVRILTQGATTRRVAKLHYNGEPAMRKIITLSIVAAALAVSACNTISGIGRDVSAAGSAVSQGADQAKR